MHTRNLPSFDSMGNHFPKPRQVRTNNLPTSREQHKSKLTPIDEARNYPETSITSYQNEQNDGFLGSGNANHELTLGRDEAERPIQIYHSGNQSMPNKTMHEQISEGERPRQIFQTIPLKNDSICSNKRSSRSKTRSISNSRKSVPCAKAVVPVQPKPKRQRSKSKTNEIKKSRSPRQSMADKSMRLSKQRKSCSRSRSKSQNNIKFKEEFGSKIEERLLNIEKKQDNIMQKVNQHQSLRLSGGSINSWTID